MPPSKNIEEAQLFGQLDQNGDGKISKQELRKILFTKGLSRDLTTIFLDADANEDGSIDVNEFVKWASTEAPPVVRNALMPNHEVQATDGAMNCSEWFANVIAEAGVTHVFGGHGGALVPMVNAIVSHPKLTWIPTRNEANASLMAAAYSKLTGGIAVCIATSGPGATNLTTGLLDAHFDQCSVIAVTGLKPTASLGYSEFQDVDQSRLFAGGGIYHSINVASATAFPPLLRDAMAKALTGYTCVHLAIPVDVQNAPCTMQISGERHSMVAVHAKKSIMQELVNPEVMEAVAADLHKLTSGRNGRILIMIGVRCAAYGKEIMNLAERLPAAVITRLDAKGCVDETHPLAWGVVGVHGKPGMEGAAGLIQSAELVMSFGVHDCSVALCNLAGLQVRPLVQFETDAVAVTFNSKFAAKHTVIGDPSAAIEQLLLKLDGLVGTAPEGEELAFPAGGEMWWDHVHSWRDKEPFSIQGRFDVDIDVEHKHCHPAKVLQVMSEHLDAHDVICVDTGDITLWASMCVTLSKGQRTLSSERLGTMGYSLCAGLVSCLHRGSNGRAIVLAGDGGVQMSINELGTVKQIFAQSDTKFKMLLIIFDNAMLGRVFFGFSGAQGCELGPSPDFVALAKAYGGDGALLEKPEDLPSVMQSAFDSEGLFVIHALVDPDVKADMAGFKDTSIKIMASG